jgi:hypothetical protein
MVIRMNITLVVLVAEHGYWRQMRQVQQNKCIAFRAIKKMRPYINLRAEIQQKPGVADWLRLPNLLSSISSLSISSHPPTQPITKTAISTWMELTTVLPNKTTQHKKTDRSNRKEKIIKLCLESGQCI